MVKLYISSCWFCLLQVDLLKRKDPNCMILVEAKSDQILMINDMLLLISSHFPTIKTLLLDVNFVCQCFCILEDFDAL